MVKHVSAIVIPPLIFVLVPLSRDITKLLTFKNAGFSFNFLGMVILLILIYRYIVLFDLSGFLKTLFV